MFKLCLTPRQDKILAFHPQRIGHAVDVIEVGNDLSGIVDAAVIQSGSPQRFDVGAAHLGGVQRQLFGVSAQRRINGAQGSSAPIAGDGVNIGISFRVILKPGDLSTEVMRMGLCSVHTVVSTADHHRQHFALGAAER